jgi:hypothetical protein
MGGVGAAIFPNATILSAAIGTGLGAFLAIVLHHIATRPRTSNISNKTLGPNNNARRESPRISGNSSDEPWYFPFLFCGLYFALFGITSVVMTALEDAGVFSSSGLLPGRTWKDVVVFVVFFGLQAVVILISLLVEKRRRPKDQ